MNSGEPPPPAVADERCWKLRGFTDGVRQTGGEEGRNNGDAPTLSPSGEARVRGQAGVMQVHGPGCCRAGNVIRCISQRCDGKNKEGNAEGIDRCGVTHVTGATAVVIGRVHVNGVAPICSVCPFF